MYLLPRWVVDGLVDGSHSPYTLLVGVALTDIAVDSGGLVVFPTSQQLLIEFVKDQVGWGGLGWDRVGWVCLCGIVGEGYFAKPAVLFCYTL